MYIDQTLSLLTIETETVCLSAVTIQVKMQFLLVPIVPLRLFKVEGI